MSFDEPVIRLQRVDKSYSIYERPHHRLLETLLGSRGRSWHREFRALRNINFAVHRGETVGIIGRNGSGKSTLLQIICGILQPTAGQVQVIGRIAALLELGAGFNPEFTGRENVYLNGSVLGLTRAELRERFGAITAFADIGEFIDQPVKTYSSGMYIRLAFAVAINVDPDILIIDEALSVGDDAFQRKCFARIEQIRNSGATVLFVSHGAAVVAQLCDRVLLLDGGELLAMGPPKPVISRYHKLLYAPAENSSAIRAEIREDFKHGVFETTKSASDLSHPLGNDDPDADHFDPTLIPDTIQYGGKDARIEGCRVESMDGRRVNVLRTGERYIYRYRVRFDSIAALVRFGMMIRTISGSELGGCASAGYAQGLDIVYAGTVVEVAFRFRCLFAPGSYFLNAGVLSQRDREEIFLQRLVDASMIRVMPDSRRLATGLVDFEFEPNIALGTAIGNSLSDA